jgi:hypothetical protein
MPGAVDNIATRRPRRRPIFCRHPMHDDLIGDVRHQRLGLPQEMLAF